MGAEVERQIAAFPCDVGVVEWPVQRHGADNKARRTDISDLTACAAACAYVFQSKGAKILTPLPEEWKGQTPKHIHTARVVGAATSDKRLPSGPKGWKTRAPGVLSGEELEKFQWTSRRDLNHNIVDGVGIGLWYFGRN